MGFDDVIEICAHCHEPSSVKDGQYGRDGKFYCGCCISLFCAERAPCRPTQRKPDPHERDYSRVVEFNTVPAVC